MRDKNNVPRSLTLVRHGESAGNVARDAALAAGHAVIDIPERDMDVPLSPRGERQACALGEWLARQDESFHPTVVLVSPYKRAQDTAALALQSAGLEHVPVRVDERLREKEFGVLDRLTTRGVLEKYPEQAAFRAALGKFYHRPPGGESWCDVVLRLRSAYEMLLRECGGERIVVVAHQVVVLCMRYVIENMTEAQILDIDKQSDIVNCGVTHYEYDEHAPAGTPPVLRLYNFAAPMQEADEPVMSQPDVPLAPK